MLSRSGRRPEWTPSMAAFALNIGSEWHMFRWSPVKSLAAVRPPSRSRGKCRVTFWSSHDWVRRQMAECLGPNGRLTHLNAVATLHTNPRAGEILRGGASICADS
jgi:hypothetical protein